MNNYHQAYELNINFQLDQVLESVECHKNNPSYELYKATLLELIEVNRKIIKPVGYVVRHTEGDQERLCCIVSLGSAIDQAVSQYFSNHDYLEGMMVNALADDILYEATNELYDLLNIPIREEGAYLTSRREPGNSDVPMVVQKLIFDRIRCQFQLDMSITDGYMLSPTKSLAYYYEVTSDDCSRGLDHDCSQCTSLKCDRRKYVIQVHKDNELEILQAKKGENLLEVLRRHKIFIEAPCSGKGTCGKCKLEVHNHGYIITDNEAKVLGEVDPHHSTLLACYHQVDRDLNIYLKSDASHHEIEHGYKPFEVKKPRYNEMNPTHDTSAYGIGVDIGTTTLAVSLVNVVTQEVIGIEKGLNPQKAYGSDIISRIMYVNDHKKDNEISVLSDLIRGAIETMTLALIKTYKINKEDIKEMVVSGNTTMIYLLLDFDPEALAVSPFTTIEMGLIEYESSELFQDLPTFKVIILPWVAAYVGGDIVSGLYANDLINKDQNILFVDIGTNGEMVLKVKDRLICASTAAGPAFEGANIKCGMGSISGAICEIELIRDDYTTKTLGDVEPLGICGSALIDAIALLHRQGLIDDMGYMENPVMIYKNIGIYPEDVRQVQLAKAAIKAGIEVLLEESNLTYEDIDACYLAGGFGSHLNVENSAYIGLIPSELLGKVQVVGNASLAGSIRYLLEAKGQKEVTTIVEHCDYIELSMNLKFNEAYVMSMTFGDLKL